MSKTKANNSGLHRDELRPVEEHQQTAHKLEAIRRYWGQWCAIIAETGRRRQMFDYRHMWLVDTCAGAGLHRSEEHPAGAIPGSGLNACFAAQRIQRKYAECEVHVRLIDIDHGYCERLRSHTRMFTEPPNHPEKVDVQVLEADFARCVLPVLEQTEPRGRQYRSLWFVDPDGVKEIPHTALDPLRRPRFGPELIVNLDVGGLLRIRGAAESLSSAELVAQADQRRLSLTYAGDSWRQGLRLYTRRQGFDNLAGAYADTFPEFEFRDAYRLMSSMNQVRYMIHLAHAERAISAFRSALETSMRVGFLTAGVLSQAQRGKAAHRLWVALRGRTVSFEDMFEAQIESLNRQQLRSVVVTAVDENYGRYDEPTKEMTWFEDQGSALRLGI